MMVSKFVNQFEIQFEISRVRFVSKIYGEGALNNFKQLKSQRPGAHATMVSAWEGEWGDAARPPCCPNLATSLWGYADSCLYGGGGRVRGDELLRNPE